MRRTLMAALVSCAGKHARTGLRRFLAGLSADELEFLAGFQGARILERGAAPSRADYESGVPQTADRDHKLLVLREYLARCGRPVGSVPYFEHADKQRGQSAAGMA